VFVGSSRLSTTLAFIQNPERFVATCTAKWGPTWYFYLAGRKILVTGDPSLAEELFGSNSDATFFPQHLYEVFGRESLLFQTDEPHARMRSLLRSAFSGVALAPIADHEARRMCDKVPLHGRVHVDLMPGIRNYILHATLQLMTGQVVPRDRVSQEWDLLLSRLHPLLLMPIHPWCRFRFWGISPWDRYLSARDQVRSTLHHLAITSTEGYPAHRMMLALDPKTVVDQLMTFLFGAIDNTAITLAWMLRSWHQEERGATLISRALNEHPPVPVIPHNLRVARPDLGLMVGDGVALAPQLLKDKSAFGLGPHRCLGVAWSQALLMAAHRALQPYLLNHKVTLGPSHRQRFSWGPSRVWLHP